MGFEAKENLSTSITMKETLTISKERISGDSFIQSVGVQVRYSGLNVLPHRIPNDHLSQLCSLCQGSLDDIHRSIT